jgi:outer membrane receptor protein involved in Fe transport
MINAEVTTPVGWFTISTGLNYRNQFTKAPTDPRAPVKSYLIARLHAVMTPPKSRIKMNFTFRNLLNAKYAYPASSLDFTNHFPARGFEAILGITARLD